MKNIVNELIEYKNIMDNMGALTHYGRITGIKVIPDSFKIETTIEGGLNVGGYLEEVLAIEFVGKYVYGNEIKAININIDDNDQFSYKLITDKEDYSAKGVIKITTKISTEDIINNITSCYEVYDIVSKKKFLCYIGELVGFSNDFEFSEFTVIHSVNTPEEAETKYLELMTKKYSVVKMDDMFIRTINVTGLSMNKIKKIIREVSETDQRHIFDIVIPNEVKLMDNIIDNLQGR